MNIFANTIKRLFSFTYRLGCKILDTEKNRACINIGYTATILLAITFVMLIYYEYSRYIALIPLIICILIYTFMSSKEILLSITGFLGIGLLYWITIIMYIAMLSINFVNVLFGSVLGYSVAIVTWCFYSLLANNKVANVANQILSALFAVVILFKDTIISSLDGTGKKFELIFNLTFSPILAINILALVLCELKGYWIEKYNGNMDIGNYNN